jgi:hypothetical protein
MQLALMRSNKRNIPKTECCICKTIDNLEHVRIIKYGVFMESNVMILCRTHRHKYNKMRRMYKSYSYEQIMDQLQSLHAVQSI